ncbi:hypothetical protein [Corynebacterium sp. HMSC28B08]|uniref:hypothetical protein n=1 Tax=Corynebacterium sp. HMSC28B08 TaxID=1581066 RepID=UPI0009F477AB|nr:hypothetical protein [Corynebacterium sp. HMSC28B08]
MKPRKALIATLAVPLLALMACSNDDEPSPLTRTNSSTPSSSSAPSTTTKTKKPTTPPTTQQPAPIETSTQAPAAQAPATAPTQEPYVVECLPGTPGPSRMSDGTVRPTDFCANQPGADAYREAERNAGLDPSEVPIANGGTCPAYKCGYGTAPDGTPNKTSGEIQFEDGCRRGYISPQQCAAAGY